MGFIFGVLAVSLALGMALLALYFGVRILTFALNCLNAVLPQVTWGQLLGRRRKIVRPAPRSWPDAPGTGRLP